MKAASGKLPADSRLLETWARKHKDALLRYFKRRVSPPEQAEDLVQEVFIRLARRADLETIERVENYLFRVAASVVADHFRKQASVPVQIVPYNDSRHGQAGFTPERVLSGRQALDQLIDALGELPDRTRQIFVLYHLEQMKQKDIAARLRMPLSTLEKHMARANRHLLKRLGREK